MKSTIPQASITDCLRSLRGKASWVDLGVQLAIDPSLLPRLSANDLDKLITLAEKNEHQSSNHPVRVARHVASIAKNLGQSPESIAHTALCGLLHDIGKSSWLPGFTRSIKGTPSERLVIESHAFEGYKILSSMENLALASLGAYTHHERLDGSGYPRHLVLNEIPPIGQMLAVADLYDAITTRPRLGLWRSQKDAFVELSRPGFLNLEYVDALAKSVGYELVGETSL